MYTYNIQDTMGKLTYNFYLQKTYNLAAKAFYHFKS